MPEFANFSENSSAPNILSVSVRARAGWRSFLASSESRAMVNAPSSSEYDEWTCRWTKPGSAAMGGHSLSQTLNDLGQTAIWHDSPPDGDGYRMRCPRSLAI